MTLFDLMISDLGESIKVNLNIEVVNRNGKGRKKEAQVTFFLPALLERESGLNHGCFFLYLLWSIESTNHFNPLHGGGHFVSKMCIGVTSRLHQCYIGCG